MDSTPSWACSLSQSGNADWQNFVLSHMHSLFGEQNFTHTHLLETNTKLVFKQIYHINSFDKCQFQLAFMCKLFKYSNHQQLMSIWQDYDDGSKMEPEMMALASMVLATVN